MSAEPDLLIGGLSLWAMDRPYAGAEGAWDRDLIRCRAVVTSVGARVEIEDFISGTSFRRFEHDVDQLYSALSQSVEVGATDRRLELRIEPVGLGHMRVEVDVTPDRFTQWHRFVFACDQTELPPLMRHCRAILRRFPVIAPEVPDG
jgi:hypothetical protein